MGFNSRFSGLQCNLVVLESFSMVLIVAFCGFGASLVSQFGDESNHTTLDWNVHWGTVVLTAYNHMAIWP